MNSHLFPRSMSGAVGLRPNKGQQKQSPYGTQVHWSSDLQKNVYKTTGTTNETYLASWASSAFSRGRRVCFCLLNWFATKALKKSSALCLTWGLAHTRTCSSTLMPSLFDNTSCRLCHSAVQPLCLPAMHACWCT